MAQHIDEEHHGKDGDNDLSVVAVATPEPGEFVFTYWEIKQVVCILNFRSWSREPDVVSSWLS